MGPEIVAAIIGPVLGGVISLGLFLNKKNSDFISKGFDNISIHMSSIECKVDEIRLDVAKNYVTNDVLTAHIKGEEDWHLRFNDDLSNIRDDISQIRENQYELSRRPPASE